MNRLLRLLFAFSFGLALVLGLAGAVAAQSGKIQGTITDATTGEGLIGATVLIEGTSQGAATDLDGNYVIIGVRPDEYTLLVTYVGYQSQRVEGVRVRIDVTTTIDLVLAEQAIEGDEVVVTAGRPLVQRDLTATTAFVSGDEIRAIPVENFDDVVNLQAGVVDGHFRGGRTGEVGYWLDGIPVTDVYDGALAIEVENASVQELQVVTGAFNAEYGQALSGIVNVVTRDGGNEFEGELSAFAGDYLTGEPSLSADDASASLFPGTGMGDFSGLDVRNVEASFSGPILRDRLFFFASGRYFANDGWLVGRDVFSFDDVGRPNGRLALIGADGLPADSADFSPADSAAFALNPYEKLSGQIKLTYRFPHGMRLSANFLASGDASRDGSFNLFYLPEARLNNRSNARTSFLKWTHLLSNRTFYEIGLTNNYSAFRNYLFEDPLDARYLDADFFGFRANNLASDFAIGGTNNDRFERQTDTWLAKVDFSSQVNTSNLVKAGIEARYHTINFLEQRTDVDDARPAAVRALLVTEGAYEYHPVEFAAYLQDKLEIGGLVINGGIRLDYFDSNGVVFRDPSDPNAVFLERRFFQRDANGDVLLDGSGNPLLHLNPDGSLNFTPDAHFQDAASNLQISPRLGVAFPISEGGVVHFSYGQFFQVPNFELLYQNPFFSLGTSGSGLIGLIGNADLRPEQTINGEIGLKQAISTSAAIELTAYYRDIRNLAGTATDPIAITSTSARYGRLVNSDFGFVRGIIFRYDQRIGQSLYAGVDYTFQVARANASDPAQVYNAAAAQQDLEQQIVPTGWDQRHTANASVSYTSSRFDAGFGLIASLGSGQPYTPVRTTQVTGGTVPPTVIPLNSETRPASFNVNLNVYKNIPLVAGTRLQVFSKVDNLFDTRNEVNVFGDTGRATYSLERQIAESTFRGNPDFLDRQFTRPDFFSQPRRVVLGLRLQF